jgi:hypothetical protein
MRTLPHSPTTDTTPTTARQRLAEPVTAWPGHAIIADPTTARILYAAWAGDPAIVVPSPPGAGKTRVAGLLAAALAHRADLRVGIAAQTRSQATEIARRLGHITDRACLAWTAKAPRPDSGRTLTVSGSHVAFPPRGGGILIATTARWLHSDPTALACDLMIVDEAWQATYADLGALGAFAEQIVCIGDPGQIDPVVTGSTTRWQHTPTGPHLPAPDALLAAHPDSTTVITLPHTWRLGPETTALIQPAFYADLPFTSRRPPEHMTASDGHPLPELAHRAVTVTAGPADAAPIHACAERTRDLLDTTITTTHGTRPTTPDDLAIVCGHVSQAAAVRAALADLPDLLVGTANQLQGLERHAVVVLHPLTGYRDLTAFTADTGRACVMLTRHRTHATVILDATTEQVLAANPDLDPALLRAQRSITTDLLATAAA